MTIVIMKNNTNNGPPFTDGNVEIAIAMTMNNRPRKMYINRLAEEVNVFLSGVVSSAIR